MNERFELTKDHITLLRHSHVMWYGGEFGAPGINCKRPFGNSDVYEDMVRILDLPKEKIEQDEDGVYLSHEQTEWLTKLHESLETALQIVLRTGSFEPGVYVADWCGGEWRKETP